MLEFWEELLKALSATTWYEYLAVVAGIASVWLSKKENILVYPVGLINTIIYVYLSFQYQLIGEATVNLYYTVMSAWGWYLWSRKDQAKKPLVPISFSDSKDWTAQLIFFTVIFIAFFLALTYLKKHFYEGAIPGADSFAAATAFTGMWLMARKKVESWYWWIATNIVGVPLYFVKGLVVTSIYYFILLVLAFAGLREWKQKAAGANSK